MTEPGAFQWCPVPGQEALGTNQPTGSSLQTPGALLCRTSDTGTEGQEEPGQAMGSRLGVWLEGTRVGEGGWPCVTGLGAACCPCLWGHFFYG